MPDGCILRQDVFDTFYSSDFIHIKRFCHNPGSIPGITLARAGKPEKAA